MREVMVNAVMIVSSRFTIGHSDDAADVRGIPIEVMQKESECFVCQSGLVEPRAPSPGCALLGTYGE